MSVREISARVYGQSADWVNPFTGYGDTDGSWGQAAWHDTHWIYDPQNGTGQEYNTKPENSIALWGIKADCAAGAKSIASYSVTTGTGVSLTNIAPADGTTTYTVEQSTPYIAYLARGYASDDPPSQWVSPAAQFASDVNPDDTDYQPATRLPDNPYVGIPTLPGRSTAITHLNRKNFVAVPEIRFAKIDPNTQEILFYNDGALVTLSQISVPLAQGFFPVQIKFDVLYVGKERPDELTPRTELGYCWMDGGQRMWMLADTLDGCGIPDALRTFYNNNNVPDISEPRRVVSADWNGLYAQGPFQAYDTFGNHNYPNSQGQTTSYKQRYMSLGGYCIETISSSFREKIFQVNFHLATDVQVYDDVEYHWNLPALFVEGNTVGRYHPVAEGEEVDSKKIAIFSNIEIDDSKELTLAEAYEAAILHECASVGWWFAEDRGTAESKATGSTTDGIGIYLPLLDDGITTGLYVTGEDIANNEQADWGDTTDIEYTPTPYDDVTPDGRSGDWTYNLHDFDLNSHKYHVLDSTKYGAVRTVLNGFVGGDPDRPILADYGGVNAGEWITCLFWYPLNIPKRASSSEQLMAGPLYLGANAPLWEESTLTNTYDLGEYEISDKTMAYTDFRGFNYTKCYLRLPFYGDFELDLHRYYGGKIKVRAIIDFSSAHGSYMIFSANKGSWYLFDTVDFKVGVQLPMSSTGMGTYQNQMHVAEKQLFNSKLALAGSVATGMIGLGIGAGVAAGIAAEEAMGTAQKLTLGGGAGVIGSLNKMADAKYALEHTAPSPGKCLPASPFCAAIQDLDVRIVFVYPKVASGYGKGDNATKLAEYGKTTGFACLQQGTLTALGLTGLTVCSNIRFNTHNQTITTQEMTLIENAIKAGIII